MTSAQRLLGLDVGERRIGVAVSDGGLAVPLSIIEHTNRERDITRVLTFAQEHEAAAIIVGMPLHASGDEGEQARLTRRFGDDLAARTKLPVLYQDELLSSMDAQASAVANGRRRKPIDDRAAAIILQRYLDAQAQR